MQRHSLTSLSCAIRVGYMRVKNISSKQLTENQFKVLAKGKNYALPHSNKNVFEFLAVTDNAVDMIEHIDREQKADIKTQVLTAVKSVQKSQSMPYE